MKTHCHDENKIKNTLVSSKPYAQLEAQFANTDISNDTTIYNIVVAALDENVSDFVMDILANPPHDDSVDS
ncbi:hypothetical protein TNIN_331971 [Trichonephila inaurata madagascariensis]|uniref:DUF7041 domain-containing protein n=1 Tax=Trichonephila inaurata madagascariensis TaxID=2747483 RepID=A0A8X6X4Q6_9ARAC|nr:hypothetical protein TNIN_331971 [Trichonephila inaurata madagascariensis]